MDHESPARPHTSFRERLFSPRGEFIAACVAGLLLLVGYVLRKTTGQSWPEVLVWASLVVGMVYGGRPAIEAIAARKFDIDVLMVVGAALAAYIGHPEEGALLLFLFVLAGALEELALERTHREVEALHSLMPAGALVRRGDSWEEVPAESLTTGDVVKVRPGERVPADAVVEKGETELDQSAITGESMPRHVKPGDELFAGTINTDDPIEARVLRPVAESSLQKILDLVTRARSQRAPVQRVIDRFSEPYALSVLGTSIVVLLVWWLVLDRPIIGGGESALYTAITFLIVASPCAVVIATPTATLAGIARAARGGVLFKGGQSMERLAGIRAAALDKTGTLTFGRPRLYQVHPVAWSDGAELLSLAAGLEEDSTHPIARAIREGAAQRGLAPMSLASINHVVANGIDGVQLDGGVERRVRLGRFSFCEEIIPVCFRNRVKDVLAKMQERGHVAVVVAREDAQKDGGGEAAVLIMADSLRPGAQTLVADMHAIGVRPIRMLTGDNQLTAERVAAGIGLDAFDADLLPADKLRILGEMRRDLASRGGVAMIGDGVNDAPALAAADVSMAMGTIGTAAALESADAIILSESLEGVPWVIRLSRRATRTVRTNLAIALGIIAIMAVATLWSSYASKPIPLSIGVLAHEGGTVLVVANSLLLLLMAGPGRGGRVHADQKAQQSNPTPAAQANPVQG